MARKGSPDNRECRDKRGIQARLVTRGTQATPDDRVTRAIRDKRATPAIEARPLHAPTDSIALLIQTERYTAWKTNQSILKKPLSASVKLRSKAGLLLQNRNPAPSAQQAAQKIAPKSSQELLEVHCRGAQNGIERVSGNALQAIALQPVFRLQMSDAGFYRRAPFHPSPQRPRRSTPLPLVHSHSYSTFIIVAAITHIHIRLTYSVTYQVLAALDE